MTGAPCRRGRRPSKARRPYGPPTALGKILGIRDRFSGRDRGTISMFTVLFTMSVFLMTGLLVDGGLAIHARERAYDIAEQAARAGANDINEATLRRTGRPEINAGTACRRTTSLLTAYNLNEKKYFDCQATTQEVTVTVHIAVEPQFLTIVPGVGTFNMTGTASAHPDKGNP